MYLRRALDSVHFSSHEKSNYLVWMQHGNFAKSKPDLRVRGLTIPRQKSSDMLSLSSLECTWYALGFRNQNPRHGETAPILGESTPPQRVNGLILSDPTLVYLW
jgi:GH43 family beta-xylosidase